ncbi:MAG: MarR family transcriptional regulator [Halobacteriaceae archaeon]
MPPLANWMVPADVEILEFLDGESDPATVGTMADALDYSEAHLTERCEELAAQGLVQPVTHDGYVLRPLGEEYLDGDVAPELLNAPEE